MKASIEIASKRPKYCAIVWKPTNQIQVIECAPHYAFFIERRLFWEGNRHRTSQVELEETMHLERPHYIQPVVGVNPTYPGKNGHGLQFVCLVGFLTSSSTTRLYRGRAPRQSVWQFYVLLHTRQSWETMTSVSASHIILTPTQPVGSGRLQRESNPEPPHQESRALPTELPRPPRSTEPKSASSFHFIQRTPHRY